jgi:hypothetical protein
MTVDPNLLGLIVLFVVFMFVPKITDYLGRTLDTLPIRLAAVILVLASISYDKFIGLGVFLVVMAVYIMNDQNDLIGITSRGEMVESADPYSIPKMTVDLEDGGHADETYETADFTPQKEDSDNDFSPVGQSQDEKHVLVSEALGSKASVMFNSDMKHAEAMAMANRNGSD